MAEGGCEQEAPSNNPKTTPKTINDFLSDDGKFAYMRLCSTELCLLYSARHERAFVKKLFIDMVKNVDLPKEVQSNLVGCLLLELDAELNDFDDDVTQSTTLIIRTLKDECKKQQNLLVIPKDLILFALKSKKYDARLRVLIYSIAVKLNISPDNVADLEDELVRELHGSKKSKEESEEDEKRKEEESSRKFYRGLMIGLGALGGGALIGITGGLAAPLIATGVGSLVGGGAAVALASIKGVAIITSLFGAAGAGLTGQKLNRRLGDIEQFEFEKMSKGDHLHVVIAISGWIKEEENAFEGEQNGFIEPWKNMTLGREQYCLKWESKYLMELGNAISSFITTSAMSMAAEEAIKHTVIQGLFSAIAWPLSILKIGYIIDNPWNVCASRASEAGKHLAHVLMDRQHGNRPVTLVGFSFGARVIFHCLKTLNTIKGSEIIQDAIMIGGPITGEPDEWKGFDKVVSGRVVNGYCKKDWLLKFVYRTASAQVKVAGLRPVMWKNRRMFNVNLTSLINRHSDYAKPENMEDILDAVSMGGVCPLDIAPTDIEEFSSVSNESVTDSGISSSHDSVAADTEATPQPDAQSEEVRLAMEELHKRVERALAEERVKCESESKEEEEICSQPQEQSSPSEALEDSVTTLLSEDKDLPADQSKEFEKDSTETSSETSQHQQESTPSNGREDSAMTPPSDDKDLPGDSSKEFDKDSTETSSDSSLLQQDPSPSAGQKDSAMILSSEDKDLPGDLLKVDEKVSADSEQIPCQPSHSLEPTP